MHPFRRCSVFEEYIKNSFDAHGFSGRFLQPTIENCWFFNRSFPFGGRTVIEIEIDCVDLMEDSAAFEDMELWQFSFMWKAILLLEIWNDVIKKHNHPQEELIPKCKSRFLLIECYQRVTRDGFTSIFLFFLFTPQPLFPLSPLEDGGFFFNFVRVWRDSLKTMMIK